MKNTPLSLNSAVSFVSILGANTFDSILNFILPKSEEENINSEALSNFLQSTLNNQT